MTTGEDKATLKRQLAKDGKVEFFYNPPPRAQYYRADGMPLPSLLPSDPYSMKRYFAKGFTLSQSREYVPSETAYLDTVSAPGPLVSRLDIVEAIATQRQETRQELYDEAAQAFAGPSIAIEEAPVPLADQHQHRYGKGIGAPCKAKEGCTAIRKAAYVRRTKA